MAQNSTLLNCIRDWLRKNEIVLLARTPFAHVGSLDLCYKYWAIIPTNDEAKDLLEMIMVADRDEILEQDTNQSEIDEALQIVPKNQQTEAYDEFMQFLEDSKEFWGDPVEYNPWIYSSGLLNAKVRKFSTK